MDSAGKTQGSGDIAYLLLRMYSFRQRKGDSSDLGAKSEEEEERKLAGRIERAPMRI